MSLAVLEMHGVRHNGSQKMGSMKTCTDFVIEG